jgi:peptidoglycan hydrolase-like protein with peptidoglycan-binding domain
VGYFGPLTRAAIEKSGGMSVSQRSPTISFMRDLATGSIGADVKALQTYLNAHGFTVASSGPGSSGHETMTFGPGTKAALVKFQKANGISPAVGYFGPKTRAAIQIQ